MSQDSSFINKQIGNYRLTSSLASGSFGSVFLANHLYLQQRSVVIKILHALRLDSEEEKRQFLQEAQFLEMLKGIPYILPLLDVGVIPDSGTPYLIAEYAEKGSLRTRIKQRGGQAFALPETLIILTQVGQALQGAHERQIVHRDLKPENILFNAQGEALLADFGISTVLSTTSVKQADVAGTPGYMAPEQFRGSICKESDQYALGCIAYELLAGRRPFYADNFVSIGYLHCTQPPTDPRTYNQQIPPEVSAAILKALAKERTERFPTITEFIEALRLASLASRSAGSSLPATPFVTEFTPTPTQQSMQSTLWQGNGPNIHNNIDVISQSSIQTSQSKPSYVNTSYAGLADPYASSNSISASSINPPTTNNPYKEPNPYQRELASEKMAQSLPGPTPIYTPSAYNYQPPVPVMQGYNIPAQPDLFLQKPALVRMVAGLNYIVPGFLLLGWLYHALGGRKYRLARFHLVQAAHFLWFSLLVMFIILIIGIQYKEGSDTYQYWIDVDTAWFFIFSGFNFVFGILAFCGIFLELPLLGYWSRKFADRRPLL